MFEDLYRIWKKTGILKRRGAKLSRLWRRNGRKIVRLWRRNGRKIKGIWKTRGTKLRRMHLEKLNKRKENGKRTQMKKAQTSRVKQAQTSRVKQGSSNNKQEIRSLSVRATNQASWKNAQISRNLANQQKGYSRSQQTSITSTR
ncbi:hypothetical protein OSF83_000129 [Enterococcus hirae]|nr:hypothetical protein [Enterococcus hirae]EMF0142421.1 hypothetical protein [Enterococcus hirae]EMF0214794.1 hypothetical protein [Enterococcus hirae]EMF0282196.1 hypothetical protein [Enterococcus hirae]EMF0502174.1 hypothetical protein [Enterococcus hirae]